MKILTNFSLFIRGLCNSSSYHNNFSSPSSCNFLIVLEFLLERLLQKKVDLLTIEALSPYMKPKILKEAYFESI
jgi:hypothetical protein